MHRDTLFHLLLDATFVIAPLGAIAAIVVLVGLFRQRGERD